MSHPQIITLITDFGLADGYVGALKGVILRINPKVRIIDITHEIEAHNVFEAAFVLAAACRFFPRGSVHLVIVDPGVGSKRKPILMETEDYYFVGPDNGSFSLIPEFSVIKRVTEISEPKYLLPRISDTFHGRDIFAPVAAYLTRGVDPREFGSPIKKYRRLRIPRPRKKGREIKGEIIHIDRFGNLISNITEEGTRDLFGGKGCQITIGGRRLSRISRYYSEVKKGGVLAIFGSSGFLEISVNQGNASQALSLGKGDPIKLYYGMET
ncbi:MAG: SAM-dependent chlorinase/fluorinase [Deltaproteobacteria bacterium]|nr:MAG: SAM-dependent chlorinase/fluorinase [Deltaproteobacteria bacterium]